MRGMDPHDPAPRPVAVVVLVGLVRQVDADVVRLVAEGEHRVETFLDLLDFAAQDTAVQRDAVVGRAEILLGAVGDGALRDPRHDVLGVDIIHDEVAVLVPVRHVVGVDLVEQVRRDFIALRRDVGRVPEVQGVGVVHRHADLERVVARVELLVAGADRQDVRKHDRVADLPVVAILRLAGQQPVLGDAEVEFTERDLLVVRADRHLVRLALLLLHELVGMAVQPFGVHRVHASSP